MLATVVLLVVALVAAQAGATDYAMEGETFSLTCSSPSGVQYWMLHGMGRAYETGLSYVQEKIKVDPDGVIYFEEVSTSHEGNHLCVSRTEGVIGGHQVTMNVRPLPPKDLWQEVYKGQFVVGLVAALVCAFIFTSGCLVFRFRYREPKSVLLNGSGEDGGHHNPGLEVDEHSTKM